jgi:lysophospholipase L1-like esterase
MGKKYRILLFFMQLALLGSNPLSFYLFFHKHPVYEFVALQWGSWIVPALFILALLKLKKSSPSPFFVNLVFSLSFTLFLLSLVIGLNTFIGYRLELKRIKQNNLKSLIFEPNQSVRYKTFEFDFTANTNSLGLRNNEFSLDKKGQFRILCIGDSWTYGWGVNDAFTWPSQLQQFLSNRGFQNIEVVNCGQPGQYPSRYREKLQQLLPLIKPDLVLAGIHQLDDLAQQYEGEYKDGQLITGHHALLKYNWMQKTAAFMKALLDGCFGNFSKLKTKAAIAPNLQQKWKEEVTNSLQKMKLAEKLRYLNLEQKVRNHYEKGELNPALLYYYLDAPDRELVFNQPDQPATQFALGILKKELDSMQSICSSQGSMLVFLNLPTPLFTGHNNQLPPSNTIQNYFLQNNHIDSMYKEVAVASHLNYLQMTEEFQRLTSKDAYFYKYDGHPTEKGYQVMATLIADFLTSRQLLKKK